VVLSVMATIATERFTLMEYAMDKRRKHKRTWVCRTPYQASKTDEKACSCNG
jgi:hypothetical protein